MSDSWRCIKNLDQIPSSDQKRRTYFGSKKPEAWKFMRIMILVETGISQNLPKNTERQNCVRDKKLYTWSDQPYVFLGYKPGY